MLTTTALFTEYIVVGMAAWLWVVPMALTLGQIEASALAEWLVGANAVIGAVLIVATYALGVLTESLSFALEKVVVGRSSSPHGWYVSRFGGPGELDWYEAQRQIWTSDGAFREFVYNRVRITISRGLVLNAGLALIVLAATAFADFRLPRLLPFFVISLGVAVLGSISWWWATAEYVARVRVAGSLAGEASSNLTSGRDKVAAVRKREPDGG